MTEPSAAPPSDAPPHGLEVTPVWLHGHRHDVDAARRLLTDDERDRADRFRTALLHDRFVLARAALRILLARALGVAAHAIRFAYSEAGKPSLRWPSAPVSFNASHSHDLALYAIGPAPRRIGVDVERHHWHDELEDVAIRFFSPAECADLRAYDAEGRIAAFYRCWVRKEAYIKAVGMGLQIALDSFQVSLDASARLIAARDDHAPDWRMEALLVAEGFEAAVAYDGAALPVVLEPAVTASALVSTTAGPA